jgi:hypothetical protein
MSMTQHPFGGEIDYHLDEKRLKKQLVRVKELMLSAGEVNVWMTLHELSLLTHYPEASISARLRDLRKPQFGSFRVSRRRRGEPKRGLFEYKMENPEPVKQAGLF